MILGRADIITWYEKLLSGICFGNECGGSFWHILCDSNEEGYEDTGRALALKAGDLASSHASAQD